MSKFNVTYAVYGAAQTLYGPNTFDVSFKLSALLNAPGSNGIVKCDNTLSAPDDPAQGVVKHFGALVNNRYFACQEGQTIDFNHGGGVPAASVAPVKWNFVVKFAVYGALVSGVQTAAQAFDVTGKVQAIADNNDGRVVIENNNFGDPAPNNKKHFALVVDLKNNGPLVALACEEGQSISFLGSYATP